MQALSPSLPDLGCQLQDPKPPNPDPGPVKRPAHPGVHCAPRPSALWRLGPDSPMTLFSLLVCGLTDGSTCLSVPWGHCECLQPVTFRGANEMLRGRAQHHARPKGRTPGRPSPTPRPGVAWGSHCRALCPSGSQAAVLWSGSPWRPLLPGQTTSLATSTSGIAKKNKRSLRLAFFQSLVRRLVSRHKACQLGGRVSSCG